MKPISPQELKDEFAEQLTPEEWLSLYTQYPPAGKKVRYVIQAHFRGKTLHLDFRLEVNDHLVGWTLMAPTAESPEQPVTTMEQARDFLRRATWKFNDEPGMKGYKVRAETKSMIPKAWLDVEGVKPPGSVGATKNFPGVFVIVDKGYWLPGVLKPYFFEYFLYGRKFHGRFVVRTLSFPRQKGKPVSGKELIYLCWKPEDQKPYVMTARGRREGAKFPEGTFPVYPEACKTWVKDLLKSLLVFFGGEEK
ncbi:MAG: hypothetical protein ACXQTL_05960 [Methanosarcinales archaeon]